MPAAGLFNDLALIVRHVAAAAGKLDCSTTLKSVTDLASPCEPLVANVSVRHRRRLTGNRCFVEETCR